jgi:hypothetical protein
MLATSWNPLRSLGGDYSTIHGYLSLRFVPDVPENRRIQARRTRFRGGYLTKCYVGWFFRRVHIEKCLPETCPKHVCCLSAVSVVAHSVLRIAHPDDLHMHSFCATDSHLGCPGKTMVHFKHVVRFLMLAVCRKVPKLERITSLQTHAGMVPRKGHSSKRGASSRRVLSA